MATERVIDFRYAPESRWTAICRPDDVNKSLVREDGALLYGFQSAGFGAWNFKRVIEFALQTHHAPIEVIQVTEAPHIPVVETTLRYKHATLALKTFAHQDGERRSDIVLWSIEVNDQVDEAQVSLHVEVFERDRLFLPRWFAPGRAIFELPTDHKRFLDLLEEAEMEDDLSIEAGPGPIAFLSTPHALQPMHSFGFRPNSALSSRARILKSGERIEGAVIIPLNHNDLSGYDLDWAKAALEQERSFWNGFRDNLRAIELPDDSLMAMVHACARNIMQAREVKDGLPVFQVGAAVYRGLWVVDGHFILECAHYMGYRDEVVGALKRLLKSAKPDGSITEMPHHVKETAISLATLVRQSELLGDEQLLHNYWEIIRKGVGYIEGMRADAAALPPESPAYKLLPPAFSDGGANGKRPEYTTAFWTLYGLKAVRDAAVRLGYHEDAARFGKNFDELLADLRRCAARDMRQNANGTSYLPQVMPGSGEHHRIADFKAEVPRNWQLQPQTATWAMCQAIWPGEVLEPNDPLVQNLLTLFDEVDDEQGLPIETGWLPYRSLWNYQASFSAHVWLYGGNPDKAIDYLYAFANHATPTRVWREEQSLSSTYNSDICGDMPHNWSSAEFIRLVRHLLVFERGQKLELLPGLAQEWKQVGKRVWLDRTPTRFGDLSLEARFGEQQCEVQVEYSAFSNTPEELLLHVGRINSAASSVLVNGDEVAVSADGTVSLPIQASNTVVIAL
jgi:hypothetical protein